MGSELSLDRTAPSITPREVEELAMTQIEVKYTPPLPASNDSTVLPMIFELKSKVVALEKAFWRGHDPNLKATVEKTLTSIDSPDYYEVVEGTRMLQELLRQQYIYSYAPYLIAEVDRIFGLLAKQFDNYQLICSDEDNPVDCQYVLITNLSVALLWFIKAIAKPFPFPLDMKLTDKTLEELVLAIVPHLANPMTRSETLKICVNLTLCKGCPCLDIRDKVLVILLRHYRRLLEQSLKEGGNVLPNVNRHGAVITDLLEEFVSDAKRCYYGCTDRRPLKHLGAILFESYKLFDIYSGITLSPDMNLAPLDTFKKVAFVALRQLCSDNSKPVPSEIWDEAFALIDCELKQLGRSKEEVPFFKWLDGQIFKRPVDESEKKADHSSMQTSAKTLDLNSGDESASQFAASGTATPEAINANSDKSTAEEVVAVDDETASNSSLVVINSDVESIDLIPESEVAEAAGDSSELVKPLKGLNSSMESILQEVQQMQAQMLQTQEMLSKLMAQLVADKKN